MEISLRNIKQEITGYTIVSPVDFDLLNSFKWYINSMGYASSTIESIPHVMHRYIMLNILKNNQYNLWLEEYKIPVTKNKIDIPDDFMEKNGYNKRVTARRTLLKGSVTANEHRRWFLS